MSSRNLVGKTRAQPRVNKMAQESPSKPKSVSKTPSDKSKKHLDSLQISTKSMRSGTPAPAPAPARNALGPIRQTSNGRAKPRLRDTIAPDIKHGIAASVGATGGSQTQKPSAAPKVQTQKPSTAPKVASRLDRLSAESGAPRGSKTNPSAATNVAGKPGQSTAKNGVPGGPKTTMPAIKPANKFDMSEIDSLLGDMTGALASEAAARKKKAAEKTAMQSLMLQFTKNANILEVGFDDQGLLVGVVLLDRKSNTEKTCDVVRDNGVPRFALSGNAALDQHILSFSGSQQKAILLELSKIK